MKSKLFVGLTSTLMTTSLLAGTMPAEAEPYGAIYGRRVVNCGAYRRPVVRHVWVHGRRTERIVCASTLHGRRVVHHRSKVHRSWKKSALVIGGSTAAGAGAGALVGGKKGALIGAAAGGAAGTAYEVHKRRKLRRHR